MSTLTVSEAVRRQATEARTAARALGLAGTEQKNLALAEIAAGLKAAEADILAANARDLAAAREAGLPAAMIRRLELTPARLEGVAAGVRDVAALPDPVGQVVERWTRPNGIAIEKVRVPLGVIGIIYESRPNVTVDAAVLCLKAGSATLLKGGKEAQHSNAALVAVIQDALQRAGLPRLCVQGTPPTREAAAAMMEAAGLIDLLIPRGGAGLIQAVVQNARVPVVETGTGVCHVYVAEDADPAMAVNIVVNGKTSNPAVCNATETLLVHRAIARDWLPRAAKALMDKGVELRGDPETMELVPQALPARDDEWDTEHLDLVLGVRVVGDLDEALEHIARHGTRHSDCIVTGDPVKAERFLNEVDAATVYWNASTRFTDGYEFGYGAEIGISNQKMPPRGPMGLVEITSHKFRITGTGQVR